MMLIGLESDPISIPCKRAKIRLLVRSGLWDLRDAFDYFDYLARLFILII